jgi:predicted O-methyltransferase YrrM
VWEQILPEDGLLIGIDANCDQAEKVHEILTHTSKKDIHIINGYSCNTDTLTRVREILDGRKVDFIFVDGDHHYEYVKEDFKQYKQFVRSGGAIGFHDVASHPFDAPINKKDGLNGGPHRFWKELRGKKFQTQAPHELNVGTGIIYL